ncbi:MAG: GNAT family N-acetyltransferase [Geminicoccales bacterium]
MSDLVIRAARLEDADALNDIANLPGFRHGTLRMPYQSVETIKQRLGNHDPNRHFLVALKGEVLVGQGALFRRHGRESHSGFIILGVHDNYRRQGIGQALLAALIDIADNWIGLTRLDLTVNVDNKPAIKLYERNGFEHEGRQRAATLRAGKLVDALMMARLRQPPTIDGSDPAA